MNRPFPVTFCQNDDDDDDDGGAFACLEAPANEEVDADPSWWFRFNSLVPTPPKRLLKLLSTALLTSLLAYLPATPPVTEEVEEEDFLAGRMPSFFNTLERERETVGAFDAPEPPLLKLEAWCPPWRTLFLR